MQEIIYLDCKSKTASGSGIEHTNLVTMNVERSKATKQTDDFEHFIPCLGGQLYIDGTEVTLWLKRDGRLTVGEFEKDVQVGGFEGKDIFLSIKVVVAPMTTKLNADLYNTPGLDAAMSEFKTEINMAVNRACARLKVNLWRIGATLHTERKPPKEQREHDEGSQDDNRDRVPEGKRHDSPPKGNGNFRR